MVSNSVPPKELSYLSSHPLKLIIGSPFKGTKIRVSLTNINKHCAFVSHIESKSFLEAGKDGNRILAIQDQLNQFKRYDMWELVLRPNNQSIIEIKWVFRNKVDELETITRNKARLESIRMLLAFVCHVNFTLFFFLMDVNSAFLNGFVMKEVYVPIMFLNLKRLYMV